MQSDFEITLDQAITLVEQFVKVVDPAKNRIPLGGTIQIDSLYGKTMKELALFNGNMAWFCWCEQSPNYPKLFLAFEENGTYDVGERVEKPFMKSLMRPTNIFGYDGKTSIDWLIQNHQIDPAISSYLDVPIERDGKDGVLSMAENFLLNGPRDYQGKPYNKYPYGFFENRVSSDIERFVKQQGIKYIRYYFGFDATTSYHKDTNRIRIVLVPVNQDGSNIVPSKAMQNSTSIVMLQKSWPPPPNV